MIRLILTDEQLKAVESTESTVEVRDGEGRLLGLFTRGPSKERLARAKERAAYDGPWKTTEEILAKLSSLEQQ